LRELQRASQTDYELVGVLVDERWNEAPKPARMLTSYNRPRPSHAKDQRCTLDSYLAICEEYNERPREETEEALRTRRWQQRIPIPFREGELDEAGLELVSAAKLIQQLDSGELYPIRNSKPANCRYCQFKRICNDPMDRVYVDLEFERQVPKKHREEVAA
jgi:hypothetical protein